MTGNIIHNKNTYLYYGIMLIIMFMISMQRPQSLPMAFRTMVMIALLIPIIINPKNVIFALACVWNTDLYSFTTILPDTKFFYLLIALVCLLYQPKRILSVKNLLFIWFYFAALSSIYSDNQLFLLMTMIGIVIFSVVKNENDFQLICNSLVIVSLYYSVLFILNRDAFAESFGDSALGLERSHWMNANTFGSIICLGATISVGRLTKLIETKSSKIEIMLCWATAFLGATVLVLNASRGALFAFVIPTILFVLFSKADKMFKIFFPIVIGLFALYLYNVGYFELLQYRLDLGTNETAGNRADIWINKLEAFLNFDAIDILFGRSRAGVTSIKSLAGTMSTHNDFITALVGYGIIGFCIYTGLYIYTYINAKPGKRLSVIILLLALAMEAFVVEPIFRGNFVSIVYFVFVYKYAIISKDNQSLGVNISN